MRDNAAETEVGEEMEARLRVTVGQAGQLEAEAEAEEPAMVSLAVREGSEELGKLGCMRSRYAF